ncbi:hypothetical protein AGMMS50239_34470 [Bacteroidia bacterium]|nr:hypothetical protein AGMMS50239_34470 [Bacteroidia bacterium]
MKKISKIIVVILIVFTVLKIYESRILYATDYYITTVSNPKAHTFQQTLSYIIIGVFGGIILLVSSMIFRKIRDKKLLKTVTKSNRGTWSERDLVLKLLKYGIPAQTIFHDLYLKKYNGDFSQIDLVVITEVGIIVFEVKDYSGWIFGSGSQSQWTKILAYGKQKYRFYNPIMQNNRHIEEIEKQLKQFNLPFYSVVVFYGNCILKDVSFIPNGTFLVKSRRVLEVMRVIKKNNEPVQYSNENEVVRILKEAVKNGENKEIQIQHIKNVNDMLGKDSIFD